MSSSNKPELFYEIIGEGPTVVLIHGWSHSSVIWSKIIPELSNHYKCICIDLPGFGKSKPLNNENVNLLSYTNEINSLLDKLIKREKIFAVISDSLGALITLRLIEKHNFYFSKVLLAGCPIDGLPSIVKFLQKCGIIYFLLYAMKSTPRKISYYFIKKAMSFTSKHPKRLTDEVTESIFVSDVYSANRILQELCEPTKINFNKLINNSTKYCVIRGLADNLVSGESSKGLADNLKAEYFEINDSGHTPMQENSEAFIKILKTFLNDK